MWARAGIEMEQARDVIDARLMDDFTAEWLLSTTGAPITNVAGAEPPNVEFSLAMVRGNPLSACVDRALNTLLENGQLEQLEAVWLNPDVWAEGQ